MAVAVLPILVVAAVNYGASVATRAIAGKRENRVDKGRFDDIRLQTSELGGTLPIVKGKARLAGNIIDHTPIVPHIQQTTTQQGSKKTGRTSTVTDNYTYTMDIDIAICAGPVSLVKIEAGTDVIYEAGGGASAVTGVMVDDYDDSDPDDPSPNFNQTLTPDGTGYIGGYLPGRNCHFAFHAGTENQVQTGVFVTVRGAANVPAYRGVAHCAFSPYQIPNGQIDNFFFTVDEGTTDLEDLVTDLYHLAGEIIGLDATDLVDASALSGLTLPGLVIPSQTQLGEVISQLEIIFGFSMIDLDGKIVAVRRGGTPVCTISESEMAAYEEGGERPVGALQIEYINERELPRVAEVDFLDPALGYHNNTAPGQIQTGNTVEPLRVVTPFVLSADAAQQAALRIVHEKHLESRPKTWTLGPEYLWLAPTDIVDLALDSGAVHRTRITGQQQALIGLGKYRGVPEQASVYTQHLEGYSGDGYEAPVVGFPANTFLALLDVPPFRPDEVSLGLQVAGCPRGAGRWNGFHLYKEVLDDEYEHLLSNNLPASIGVVASEVSYTGDPTQFDRDGEIVLDLYYDAGDIQSRPESELLQRPVNLIVYGRELLQYADAEAEAATAPYAARYRLTNLMRGLYGTEDRMTAHDDDETCAVVSDAVQFIPEEPNDIGATRNYKGVTIGQSIENAPVTELVFLGASLLPLSVTNVRGLRHANDDLLVTWEPRARFAGGLDNQGTPLRTEDRQEYQVEIYDASTGGFIRRVQVIYFPVQPAVLEDVSNVDDFLVPTNSRYLSKQLLPPDDSFVEARLEIATGESADVGLWINEGQRLIVATVTADDGLIVTDLATGGVVYTQGKPYDEQHAQVRVALIGGEIQVYLNPADGQLPLYRSPLTVPLNTPVKGYFFSVNSPYVSQHRVRTSDPYYLYPAEMQAEDFGSVPATVKVRIYQVSALVGRGPYTEKILP